MIAISRPKLWLLIALTFAETHVIGQQQIQDPAGPRHRIEAPESGVDVLEQQSRLSPSALCEARAFLFGALSDKEKAERNSACITWVKNRGIHDAPPVPVDHAQGSGQCQTLPSILSTGRTDAEIKAIRQSCLDSFAKSTLTNSPGTSPASNQSSQVGQPFPINDESQCKQQIINTSRREPTDDEMAKCRSYVQSLGKTTTNSGQKLVPEYQPDARLRTR